MSLPTIILNKGQMLVAQGSSSLGLISLKPEYVFGTVQDIYSGSDKVTVNQVILFQPDLSAQILYGSTIYFIVDESKSLFQEIPPS